MRDLEVHRWSARGRNVRTRAKGRRLRGGGSLDITRVRELGVMSLLEVSEDGGQRGRAMQVEVQLVPIPPSRASTIILQHTSHSAGYWLPPLSLYILPLGSSLPALSPTLPRRSSSSSIALRTEGGQHDHHYYSD